MYIVWRHVSLQWLVQCFLSMAGASFIVTNSRNVLFQWLVQSSQAQICFGAAACNIIFGAERPNHRLASMISGFISCPQYDWTCRSCGKSWTEKDSARQWVFPRPCGLCHRDMETWRTPDSLCSIFKLPVQIPSPREEECRKRRKFSKEPCKVDVAHELHENTIKI